MRSYPVLDEARWLAALRWHFVEQKIFCGWLVSKISVQKPQRPRMSGRSWIRFACHLQRSEQYLCQPTLGSNTPSQISHRFV